MSTKKDIEIERLRAELHSAKKENTSLRRKLKTSMESAKRKKEEIKELKNLKKKVPLKKNLTDENLLDLAEKLEDIILKRKS